MLNYQISQGQGDFITLSNSELGLKKLGSTALNNKLYTSYFMLVELSIDVERGDLVFIDENFISSKLYTNQINYGICLTDCAIKQGEVRYIHVLIQGIAYVSSLGGQGKSAYVTSDADITIEPQELQLFNTKFIQNNILLIGE